MQILALVVEIIYHDVHKVDWRALNHGVQVEEVELAKHNNAIVRPCH